MTTQPEATNTKLPLPPYQLELINSNSENILVCEQTKLCNIGKQILTSPSHPVSLN